jgi:hypothetical protein
MRCSENKNPRINQEIIRPIRNHFVSKYDRELSFWRSRLEIDNGRFENSHCQRLMLAMARNLQYAILFNVNFFYRPGQKDLLWVKARKLS